MQISLEANWDELSAMKLLHLARKMWALEEDLSKCKGSATFRALPHSVGAGPEEVNLVDSMASKCNLWASLYSTWTSERKITSSVMWERF